MVKNINTNITKTDQTFKAQTLNSRTKIKNQKSNQELHHKDLIIINIK